MRITVSALLVSTLVLTGCGTNLNPLNWFGGGTSEPRAPVAENDNPLIPERTGLFSSRRDRLAVYNGTAVETVTDLTVERVPGGAIIRATGVAAVQGIYDVRLTPANEDEVPEDGILTYRLEALRSADGARAGTPASREVTAARKVTDRQLAGVSRIRVEGVTNAQVSRR